MGINNYTIWLVLLYLLVANITTITYLVICIPVCWRAWTLANALVADTLAANALAADALVTNTLAAGALVPTHWANALGQLTGSRLIGG